MKTVNKTLSSLEQNDTLKWLLRKKIVLAVVSVGLCIEYSVPEVDLRDWGVKVAQSLYACQLCCISHPVMIYLLYLWQLAIQMLLSIISLYYDYYSSNSNPTW